jgi:hypothetical protein
MVTIDKYYKHVYTTEVQAFKKPGLTQQLQQHMENRERRVGVAIILAIVSMSMSLSAAITVVDITINSGHLGSRYGNDPRPTINASGWVNPNCVASNEWDLKFLAYDYSTNQLILGSGFNQLAGKDGIILGDIFFDTNSILTSPSRPVNADGNYKYPNPGFEFCIDIKSSSVENSTLTFDLIGMYSNSIVQSGSLNQNRVADPATIVRTDADKFIGTGVAEVKIMIDDQIRSLLDIDVGNNGKNYVSFFDLPANFLPPNTTVKVKETLTCLNDDVWGQYTTPDYITPDVTAVPEPGNCLATMTFLCSGALIRFRRRK